MALIHPVGYEAAYIGTVEVDSEERPLYDRNLIVDILMDRDGMTEDEAEEFFEYNIAGSYLGSKGPVYASFARGEST